MMRIRVVFSDNWKLALVVASVVLVLVCSYIYKLVGLTKGMDDYELRIIQTVTGHELSPLSLIRESLWLPHDLYLYVLQYLPLGGNTLFWSRSFSVACALAAIVSMYYVLSKWHSPRVALIGTVSFAYASWLLIVGRYAFPFALYVLPLVALSGWAAMRSGYRKFGLTLTSLATLASLYIPGLVWVMLAAVLLQRRQIAKFLRAVPQTYMYAVIGIGILGLVPLIASIIWPPITADPLRAFLAFGGLPTEIVSIQDYVNNLYLLLQSIFWGQEYATVISVGLAPLLNFYVGISFLIGFVELAKNGSLDRSKILLSWLFIGFALVLIGGVSATILLPVIYLISAQGVWQLMDMWLSTFPRNPVARNTGIALVASALVLSVGYSITSYFLAWPHTSFILTEFIH